MLTDKPLNLVGFYSSVLLAMSLNIYPLPSFFKILNPDWVLLVLICWVFAVPQRVGVFNAWSIGIVVDILTGRMLGQSALVYALITFVILKLHRRLRNYLLPQQALFVFVCLFFSRTFAFWMENRQGQVAFFSVYLLPVLIGALLWPLLNLVLGYFGLRRVR